MIRIYHNNSCSKSLCALTVLEESKQPFEVINYLEATPTAEELRDILNQLGISAHDLIRKGESIYKEKYEGKNLSNEEWILAMIENPILIERPIIVTPKGAVIARPMEKMYEVL
jgi:arsenate reductase